MKTSDEKKFFMLLKSVIFYYHGLNEDEKEILDEDAQSMDAHEELNWALEFIKSDEGTSFSRSREYFTTNLSIFTKEDLIKLIANVWESNNKKGYITEMEATGMLKIVKDWGIQTEFLSMARPKMSR